METHPDQPNPPIDLVAEAYRHLIRTLISLLPPPLADNPEALRSRNHAAIARIAALAPVNANEAELAAQCITTRAQAEDVLRLIRLHADDIKLVMRLNAQYAAMVRISLAVHGHLLREQQQRRKREATPGAADTDEWTRHIATNTMLHALAALPALPTESDATASVEVVPETAPESHTLANETPLRQSMSPPARPANPPNRVIDLRSSLHPTVNQGWPDDTIEDGVRSNSVVPHPWRVSH